MSLGGRDEPSLGVIVYGPDGRAYGSPAEARNAGVSNPTMSPPADVPLIPYGRAATPRNSDISPSDFEGSLLGPDLRVSNMQTAPQPYTPAPQTIAPVIQPYTPAPQTIAPAIQQSNPMGEASLGVIVYGPDGRAYGSPLDARNAGVSNPTMSPPAGIPISYPGRQPYTPAPLPGIPTQSSGGRNRYAEIMSQFGQSQPFSFFGMPSGGFNPYASNYTGGFTPYQRLVTPQPALPVEGTTSATAGGGGGGGANREAPSAWSQMTPAERAAYYAANPTEGKIALGMQDLFGNVSLMGQAAKYLGNDGWYDSRLEKMGVNPTIRLDTQGILAGTSMQKALNALNPNGGFVSTPDTQAVQNAINNTDFSGMDRGSTSNAPSQAEINAGIAQAEASAQARAQVAANAAAAAPAPAPVQMMNVTETYQGEDPNPPGGWTQVRTGKDTYKHIRTVSVPAETRVNQEDGRTYTVPVGYTGGGGGSQRGGESVGGYAPGSQAAAAAASGQFGMGPGTPGFNSGGANFAQGGYVSMMHLGGPNPMGPDDGYAALKDGEFVINDKAVKKYGIELMNAINSGKISKGKLRGLLEM